MEGFDLILIARRQERLNEIQKDLYETYGTLVEVYAVDVRDYESIDVLAKEIPQVDVLINNA